MLKKIPYLFLLLILFWGMSTLLNTNPSKKHLNPNALSDLNTPQLANTFAYEWLQLTPNNTGPGSRYDYAMVYHPTSNSLYLFGGRDDTQVYNDVWQLRLYDLNNLTWRKLAANTNIKPPSRHSAIMMIDETAQYLYIAMGRSGSNSTLDDIWQLNLNTETWQNLTNASSLKPADRYAFVGGTINNNLLISHGFGSASGYNDSWLFDTSTNQWTNITPATGALPASRFLLDGVTSADSLIMQGGCSASQENCLLDDTWILDTSTQTWLAVNSEPKPMGRRLQSLAYFKDINQVALFGGRTQNSGNSGSNALWFLNLDTLTWQQIMASGASSIPPRHSHKSVWIRDNALKGYNAGMIVYGGNSNGTILDDLWFFHFLPKTVQFSTPTYTIQENANTATITVTRLGSISGTLSVYYQSQDDTAIAGEDYTPISGTLTFNDGVNTPQTFTVPILDDTDYEADKTLFLTLEPANEDFYFTVGNPNIAQLTIFNDDAPAARVFLPIITQVGHIYLPIILVR